MRLLAAVCVSVVASSASLANAGAPATWSGPRPLGMPAKLTVCADEACFVAALEACRPAVFSWKRTHAEDAARFGGGTRDDITVEGPVVRVVEASWPGKAGCNHAEQRSFTTRVPTDQAAWNTSDGPLAFWSSFASGQAALGHRAARKWPALGGHSMPVTAMIHLTGPDVLTVLVTPFASSWLAAAERARTSPPKELPPQVVDVVKDAPVLVMGAFVPTQQALVGEPLNGGGFSNVARVWSNKAQTMAIPVRSTWKRPDVDADSRTFLKNGDPRLTAAQRVLAKGGAWLVTSFSAPEVEYSAYKERMTGAVAVVDAVCVTPAGSVRALPFVVEVDGPHPRVAMIEVANAFDGALGALGPWGDALVLPTECAADHAAYVASYQAEVKRRADAEDAAARAEEERRARSGSGKTFPEECKAYIKAARALAKALYISELSYNAEFDRYTTVFKDLGFVNDNRGFTVEVETTERAFTGRVVASATNPYPNMVMRITGESPAMELEGDLKQVCNKR